VIRGKKDRDRIAIISVYSRLPSEALAKQGAFAVEIQVCYPRPSAISAGKFRINQQFQIRFDYPRISA
jgi:hypothetical protein